MLNTPENRAAFVAEFGPAPRHDGRPGVTNTTAHVVLRSLDDLPEHYGNWKNLWSRIMQDDATHMLGQPFVDALKQRDQRVTHARYDKIGRSVTDAIYRFCEGRG